MDPTDDLWTAIRGVLPGAEELAAAVAAELGEPIDDVRLSVLIGTIAIDGQLGPESAAAAAIEEELSRLESAKRTTSRGRRLHVDSLGDLLAETQAIAGEGSLDLDTIVAIQGASGAIAAKADRPLIALQHRYAVTRRWMWEHCVAAMRDGRLEPGALAAFGRFLLLWNELTSLAVADGYRSAERDILARSAEARRSALQELLGVIAADPTAEARLRRVAVRHGLEPDRAYRVVAIAAAPDIDPRPGDDELEVLAGRVGHLLGVAGSGAEGIGAGIRLPAVLPLMGHVALLARADWAGLTRLPVVLDRVVGGLAAEASPAGTRRARAGTRAPAAAWVAVGSRPIEGVASLAVAYADLVDATRTAWRLGLRGWIAVPEQLALERLLLADPDLADATVRRELGPLLADERLGKELIETLQAYFDAGENVTAAARGLHLATRTVAYRLQKIESLLGHSLDGENGRRLSTALMVHRLRSVK